VVTKSTLKLVNCRTAC